MFVYISPLIISLLHSSITTSLILGSLTQLRPKANNRRSKPLYLLTTPKIVPPMLEAWPPSWIPHHSTVWRGEPQHGFLRYHSSLIASISTNRPFETQSISDMDELFQTPTLSVLAASHSTSVMLPHAQKVGFHPYTTMTLQASEPHSYPKCVQVLKLNHTFNHSQGNALFFIVPTLDQMPVLIWLQTEFGGVHSREYILMSGFSTPLSNPTSKPL